MSESQTGSGYRRWVCDACGYIYNEAAGDPDSGLQPGTRYEDIPDDWQCPLCGLSKGDLRLLPEAPAAPVRQRSRPAGGAGKKSRGGEDYVVIVGGGTGGWSVAEAIREQDPDTPLLLVSACEGISYPKPALSTAFAHGKRAEDLAEMDAASHAEQLGLEVRTETRVLKLDTARQRLTTARGGIQYGKLVLALGARQRELPLDGDAADTVVRVNDLTAYRKLRQRLDAGVKHITILGAGLIGTEFAEDLSIGGFEISVIDPTDFPLSSLLPGSVGQELRNRLQEKGVQWHFHCTLDSVEHAGERLRATLSNGEALETDLVLSAAGLVPNTGLAQKAGIAVDQGIATDVLMRTSASGVYAIGDCAAVEGQVFAYIEPIRRQAATIAAELRGESLPFDTRPPLVRVKTPSFPLTVCPPVGKGGMAARAEVQPGRVDFYDGDALVGFVLSGDKAAGGTGLYRSLLG
jgi:rubredoxin-NAD+ reductase